MPRLTRAGRALVGAAVALVVTLGWAAASRAGAPEQLVVGLNAFRDGFYEVAANQLRGFLESEPADPRREEVLYVLAQAEMARARWSEAREALTELAGGSGPRASDARYWLGWVALQEGKTAEALRRLEAYLKEPGASRRGDALFLCAGLSRKAGQPAQAAEQFREFLRANPGDKRRPEAWTGLVDALTESGRAADAQREARRALVEPSLGADSARFEAVALAGIAASRKAKDPKGEALFWSALSKRAASAALRVRARFEEGAAWSRAGDKDREKAALEGYLKAEPAGGYAARSHLMLAELSLEAGDRKEAFSHLQAALERPEDPAVKDRATELRKTAFALALALGERDKAAGYARALAGEETALGPEEKELVRLTLADAAVEAGNMDEALREWGAVPPGDPHYRQARLLAARALIERSRPAEALEWVEPLLKVEDPGAEARLTALAAAEAVGDQRRAAELCAVLAADPPPGGSSAEYLYRRALHLASLGDSQGYVDELEALATSFPDAPEASEAAAELQRRAFDAGEWSEVLRWSAVAGRQREGERTAASRYLEAEALFRLNRMPEARAAFEEVAGIPGPFRANALTRLGSIYDRAGEYDQAVRAYLKALDAGLTGEQASWVRDRLALLGGGVGGSP